MGRLGNALVLMSGGALLLAVGGAQTGVVKALQARNELAAVQGMPQDSQQAAERALNVLREYPRSYKAFLAVECRTWNTRMRDHSAALLQVWVPFGLTPASFARCTGDDPIGRYFEVLGREKSGKRYIGLLILKEGVPWEANTPTWAQITESNLGPAGRYVAVACRHMRSGLPLLADAQMRTFREGLGSPDSLVSELPAAWGCEEVAGLGLR